MQIRRGISSRWLLVNMLIFGVVLEALMLVMAWTRPEAPMNHEFLHNTWGLTLSVVLITSILGYALWRSLGKFCHDEDCMLRNGHDGLHKTQVTRTKTWE